ncbi:hypothetical protein HID58_085381, partial [Brassica napus]
NISEHRVIIESKGGRTCIFSAISTRRARRFTPLSTNCVITIIIITLLPKNMNQIQFVQKESPLGSATESAHPARFSPDDKYSKERVLLKKRFGLLPIQGAPVKY